MKLKFTKLSVIDWSSISNFNRFIDINGYRLISITIDYWFHRLITPGLSAILLERYLATVGYWEMKQNVTIKDLVCVHFLNIYSILIYSTSFNRTLSRWMHWPMSGSYASEIGSRNYNCGGFSVVKHLYLLEIALYCWKEMPRTFWGRLQTDKCVKLHISRLPVKYLICIRSRHGIPLRLRWLSNGKFKVWPVAGWLIRSVIFVSFDTINQSACSFFGLCMPLWNTVSQGSSFPVPPNKGNEDSGDEVVSDRFSVFVCASENDLKTLRVYAIFEKNGEKSCVFKRKQIRVDGA